MKPILFNTEEVRATIDGRKSMKRLVVKPQPKFIAAQDGYGPLMQIKGKGVWFNGDPNHVAPYRPGDILYVRERVAYAFGRYDYRADYEEVPEDTKPFWKPSIHMPKEAARLFLRVTDVRVERLQDITIEDTIKEGCSGVPCDCSNTFVAGGTLCCADCMNTGWQEPPTVEFWGLWDSTIKKADLPLYGWEANPWVWAIEFEKISKKEAIKNGT